MLCSLGSHFSGDWWDFRGRRPGMRRGGVQRLGEFRQAFLRLIGANRFLPSRIPHLSLRLKVSVPGVVGMVSQDGLDGLPVFDGADDAHDSPTLRTSQGIDLVDLLTQPG